jgi:hypothetical protein
VGELFEVMQEYCKSDHGRRRRIEAMNQEKKARTNQWSQSKPWHADQPKQQNQKLVNTVSRGQQQYDFQGPLNRGGPVGRGGRGPPGSKVPICYFHGRDQGHWTNECPFAKEENEEMEKKPSETPKSVNYTSGGDRAGSSASMPQWPTTLPTFNYNLLPYMPQYLPL